MEVSDSSGATVVEALARVLARPIIRASILLDKSATDKDINRNVTQLDDSLQER